MSEAFRRAGTSSNAFLRLFRGETSFDFVGRWRRWFIISGIVIAIGWASVGIQGINLSIEFRGGTSWSVPTSASVADVQHAIAGIGGADSSLRQATVTVLTNRATDQRTIQVEAAAKETANSPEVAQVTNALAEVAHVSPNAVELNDIGPSWGANITRKAIEAIIVFLVLVSVFIWMFFEAKMAIAALVALAHDILITVGIYSLSGFQVSPDTVIAFLTVLGYSLYDTIVVFDRVRENTKGLASTGRLTYSDTVNLSINQVLARSVNTSIVAILPILSILVIGAGILGASALEDFGLALTLGLTTGAYSSIFIAAPLLALLKEREVRYSQIRTRLASRGRRAPLTPAAVAAARGRTGSSQIGGSQTTSRSNPGSPSKSSGRPAPTRRPPGSGERPVPVGDPVPSDAEVLSPEQEAALATDDLPVEENAPLTRPRKRTGPRLGPAGSGTAYATLEATTAPTESAETDDDSDAGDAGGVDDNAVDDNGGDKNGVDANGATDLDSAGSETADRPGAPRGNRPPPRPRKKGRRR